MPLEFECPVGLSTEDILENREALDNVAMLPLCRAGFQVPAGNRTLAFICFGVHSELIPGIVRPPYDPRSGHLFPW